MYGIKTCQKKQMILCALGQKFTNTSFCCMYGIKTCQKADDIMRFLGQKFTKYEFLLYVWDKNMSKSR
jgi:hypothetical protein